MVRAGKELKGYSRFSKNGKANCRLIESGRDKDAQDNADAIDLKNQAATAIQAAFRGFITRANLHKNRQKCGSKSGSLLDPHQDRQKSSTAHKAVQAYSEMHGLNKLFKNLMSRVLIDRPTDLRVYLLDILTEMSQQRTKAEPETQQLGIFETSDFDTYYTAVSRKIKKESVPASKVVEISQNMQPLSEMSPRLLQMAQVKNDNETDNTTFGHLMAIPIQEYYAIPK